MEDAEVQETFAGLLLRDSEVKVEEREIAVLPVPMQEEMQEEMRATGTEGVLLNVAAWGDRPERRWSASAVLLTLQQGETKTPLKLSFGRGSNIDGLAEREGFEPSVP